MLNQKAMMKSLKHYRKYGATLHDDQSNELLKLVSSIPDIGKDELEKVLQEADKKGRGDRLRNIWKLDVEERLKFQKDQKKNGKFFSVHIHLHVFLLIFTVSGKRGNRWSTITFRMGIKSIRLYTMHAHCWNGAFEQYITNRCMFLLFDPALAVYTRSPSAYEALKSFQIIQLPGVMTLKEYINSNRDDPGKIQERLKCCRENYDRVVRIQQQLGNKQIPICKGVLIFDEVKVGLNVQWNSRTDEFIGHSMTSEEMSSLLDIYVDREKTDKTSYVLQTLWRGQSSDYDIIGPYYTSSGGLKNKFLVACLFDAMRQFHQFSFTVTAVVCDGASSNLTALKALCHHQGAYGHDSSLQDQHKVPVYLSKPLHW